MNNLLTATALFTVVALTAGRTLMAQTPRAERSATEARNVDIVQQRFAAWRAGTGSPFDLLTDSATWTIVGRSLGAGTYQGRAAFLHGVIRSFNARMRGGIKPAIRRLYADGNTVIVFFDAEGTARDGLPYRNTYAWFLEMQDGRITGAWAFFDSLAFDDLWRRVPPT
jgi:ketosteroid isomerase-like protein